MEWIETTGKTVEEARELALDQLGVDETEAEFEIVAEPKPGLFGRTRGVARVRARVSPKAPRPKVERKRRPNNKKKDGSNQAGNGNGGDATRSERNTDRKQESGGSQGQPKQNQQSVKAAASGSDTKSGASGDRDGSRAKSEKKVSREPMDPQDQIKVVEEFLTGLLGSFGIEGTLESTIEEKDLRTNIVGENLGLLVGPRLGTLDSVQELTRLALQREAAGKEYARVTVDVSGIREERKGSLEQFVVEVTKQVRESNKTVVFEEMSSADRKQVHDLASTIDGVRSVSEGEDPLRRVALVPAGSD